MRVTLTTLLDTPAERAWAEVQTARLLEHVAAPLLVFTPINPQVLPTEWIAGTFHVGVRLFGRLSLGTQWIVTTMPSQGPDCYQIRDNGRGTFAKRWDHMITIEPLDPARCCYRDDIAMQAGLLTPFVWVFARLFYAYRQRRWRRFVARGFAYTPD